MVLHLKPTKIEDNTPVYYIKFEEYLKPKSVNKKSKQLLLNTKHLKKPELHLKLLQHPVLIAGCRKSKWQMFKNKISKFQKTSKKIFKKPASKLFKNKVSTFQKTSKNICENLFKKTSPKPKKWCNKNDKLCQMATKWHNKTFKNSSKFSIRNIKLPSFLSFLKARNDDGLCKRKSGFEIYCEMASIHGFFNFVGATTWQRAFWCFIVFIAVTSSGFLLLLSHFRNTDTPTILYTESTQYPTWSIPFPAVTICNLNRLSKRKAHSLAESFHKSSNLSVNELANSFRLALYTSENITAEKEEFEQLTDVLKINNFTLFQLINYLKPNCEEDLLRCKWKGHFMRCGNIFEKIQTSYGECCSFNYHALKENLNKRSDIQSNLDLEYTTSCGYKTGLTVLLNPNLEDYKASMFKISGFQVLIHDSYELADNTALNTFITPRSFNKISIVPQQTHATEYVTNEKLYSRRCYLPNERKLFHFPTYSHSNCLAECRSQLMYKKCHCILPNWARKANWTECGLMDEECVLENKRLHYSDLKFPGFNYRANHYAEQFICDCYPLCDFNMYTAETESGKLDRRFSLTDKRFFKNINITNHILLHVFYGELFGERLRLDVYENWLTFIGTFGGIAGLHMGYSFVSGFEMIFFVFVRPACNWLTKKQIKYRIKRRQKKQHDEREKKRKLEMEKERQEKIEAFLRMRPYCPGY